MRNIVSRLLESYVGVMAFLLLLGGCGNSGSMKFLSNGRQCPWQVQKKQSDKYLKKGDYKTYISGFKKCLARARQAGDTASVLYSCAYISQAYLFLENSDSVKYYLNCIDTRSKHSDEVQLKVLLANIKGLYAIKFEMNLSKALDAFQTGYRLSLSNDIENKASTQISFLLNMGNIFFIRSDVQGMDYAKRALSLVQHNSVDDFRRSLVYINMAMMQQLAGRHEEAFHNIKIADSIASREHLKIVKPDISLLYANYYRFKNDYGEARKYYENVLADSVVSDDGTRCLTLLNYGKLFEKQGDLPHAIACYKKGLWVSSRFGNTEFRKDFYHRLSHMLYVNGDHREAVECFNRYWIYLDSLAPLKQEQRFNSLMRSYQQAKYENAIQRSELELMKAKRRSLYVIFALVIFFIVMVTLLLLFRRQRAMYHQLYKQHQKYLNSLKTEPVAVDKSKQEDSDKMTELFGKIEQLMEEEKIYRHKDISLASLSDRLNSNKTYISNAINRFSGQSFRDYLASLRIRDAVMVISDPNNTVPLKQLADELGFNSISVFNKTFQKETGLPPGQYRKEAREERPRE